MVFGLICLFLILVLISGEFFVNGALGIATKFKISTFILGATIVAIGTSSPDLFLSTVSSLKGHYDVASGALIGSSIANILLCIGVASLISGVRCEKTDVSLKFGMKYHTLFISLFCILIFVSGGKVGFFGAFTLIAFSVFFIFCSLKCTEFKKKGNEDLSLKSSNLTYLFLFFAGMAGLILFSNLLLKYVVIASEAFNVPKKVISAVILGMGNSTPELVTSIIAAKNKRSRIVIGNIVGSNIFILGFVLGFSALFSNFQKEQMQVVLPILTVDFPFLLVSGILFFAIFKIKNEFGRISGLIFIFLYLLYILLQANII